MKRIITFFLSVFFLAFLGVRTVAAQTGPVLVYPKQGDVLQGVVTIRGAAAVGDFLMVDVAFTYIGDTTGTWFLIATDNQAINSDSLAIWDTTTITDGDYILRLRTYLKDGSFQDVVVPKLHVRNYTPIETPTPAPTPMQPTATPTATSTATPFPSPTPLLPNPAFLTSADVMKSTAYGGIGGFLFLVILGIYLGLRKR